MATQYSVIYDAFLGKIKDYDFGILEAEVVEYDMLKLLKSAIIYFKVPEFPFTMDDVEKEFSIDFTNDEIQIIAILMKREWFRRIIANTDVLIQKFGEADFEFKSQASHLNALNKAELQVVDKEVKEVLSGYSRIKNGKVFDYGKLAGKRT
jgi:hypothetical protein